MVDNDDGDDDDNNAVIAAGRGGPAYKFLKFKKVSD